MTTLKIGSTGTEVMITQELLGITADGDFGPITEAAVKAFQAAHGLAIDGVVGPLTSAALNLGNAAPAPSGDILFVDVSEYEPTLKYSKIGEKAACITARASHGLNADKSFKKHEDGVRKAGKIFQSYHFITMDSEPRAQADFYWKIAGAPQKGDLPHCGDSEPDNYSSQAKYHDSTKGGPGYLDAPGFQHTLAFMQHLAQLMGVSPWFYTNPYWLMNPHVPTPKEFAKYPLWNSGYIARSHLVIPAPWTPDLMIAWQYTDKLVIEGAPVPIDASLFSGGWDKLNALRV